MGKKKTKMEKEIEEEIKRDPLAWFSSLPRKTKDEKIAEEVWFGKPDERATFGVLLPRDNRTVEQKLLESEKRVVEMNADIIRKNQEIRRFEQQLRIVEWFIENTRSNKEDTE